MSGNDSRKRGDSAFVAALAAGASVVAAAKQGGISEATAHRRLRDPDTRKLVDQARAEIVSRAVAKLSAASTEAADTLKQLLHSEMDFARLAAARSILELGAKLREHEDLAERVRMLEERILSGENGEPATWKPRAV